jgi:hypothetical protein
LRRLRDRGEKAANAIRSDKNELPALEAVHDEARDFEKPQRQAGRGRNVF